MDLAPEESSLPTDIQQVGLCVYPGPEQVKDANFDTSPLLQMAGGTTLVPKMVFDVTLSQ